jgi:DNA-binding CsgD family transcriptional regulator
MRGGSADPALALAALRREIAREIGTPSLPAVDAEEPEVVDARLREAVDALTSTLARGAAPPRAARLVALLRRADTLRGELVTGPLLRSIDMRRRIDQAIARLAGAGSADELLMRAPTEAGWACRLDCVVLSRVPDGLMRPVAVHVRGDAAMARGIAEAMRARPPRLAGAMVESQVLRRRAGALVVDPLRHPRVDRRTARLFRVDAYVVAPVVRDAEVVALLHGDRMLGPEPPDALDVTLLEAFATALSGVLRAVALEERIAAAQLTLGGARPAPAADRPDQMRLRSLLTPREQEVMELLATGATNRAIAERLVVTEGTAKFHVRQILRKLHARNRSEAVARYRRIVGA